MKRSISIVLLLMLACFPQLLADTQRWPEERANAWYQQQPWLVGSNFIPATAINEMEFQVVAEATVVTEHRSQHEESRTLGGSKTGSTRAELSCKGRPLQVVLHSLNSLKHKL